MRIGVILGLLVLFLGAIPAQAQSDPFIGEVEIVAYNFAPAGWAQCNGQLMSIDQFPALFNLIGTTYGGDGEQTFALPDLRGRMAIGVGQGPGLSPFNEGDRGGEEQVTLTLNQLPMHSHLAVGTSTSANALGPGGTEWATTTTFLYSSTAVPSTAMNSKAIDAVGGGLPHENRPPFLALNFIISLFGIFPTQG